MTVLAPNTTDVFSPLAFFQQALAYGVDAWQRQVLFWDLLRRRGNTYFEQQEQTEPNVLDFEAKLLIDGRHQQPPVNYLLLQILPPPGVQIDSAKRPFIIFDPRAGQGPGIGGLKKESEVGLALARGHPVYFVSFLPAPMPGQTIEDVCALSARFVEDVRRRHPEAEKPCLIGNCQAGWQIALMSSLEPALPGVLLLAGAPLHYWGGNGKSPARYIAGLAGGSWLTAFLSDIGGGLFDGAWLVQSFELGNPANTFWRKPYGVYAKVDTEAERFLHFERWWGTPILFGGEEMQFITDELFIGNHLTQGKIHASDGRRADLRHIKSPIVIFCSEADEITPPQQALDWMLEVYACDEDIIAREQTIVYARHAEVGHLGLFVSSSVMSKELLKFITNMDIIESLPPGLFEAQFIPKTAKMAHADLVTGQDVLRFERRSLADIRAMGCNDLEDDRQFETVSRLSENLQGLYYTCLSPFIRALFPPEGAAILRQMHPLRFSFAFFSDKNPMMALLPALAPSIQAARKPVPETNIFWQLQEQGSAAIVQAMEFLNASSASAMEALFRQVYGAPLMQAALGLRTVRPFTKAPPEKNVEQEEERRRRLGELRDQIEKGGLIEATVRGLLYVSRAEHVVDERAFRMLGLLRKESSVLPPMDLESYKAITRQQYMMLVLDEERAVKAIPLLLDRAEGKEKEALQLIRQTFEVIAPLSAEETRRLKQLEALFVPAGLTPRRRKTDRP